MAARYVDRRVHVVCVVMCPICEQPRIRRGGRGLLTCGSSECATALRALRTRGRTYDRADYPDWPSRARTPNATYGAVHSRARRIFKGQGCVKVADGTCKGRIEVALRADIPQEALRREPERNVLYYGGLDTENAYRPLCRSHHSREGALRTALLLVEKVLADHPECVERVRQAVADDGRPGAMPVGRALADWGVDQ